MRYVQIETISFRDINGVERPIKDIRPIPEYQTLMTIKVKESDRIDEIASRESIYGEGGEDQSFKIYDHNIVKFVDSRYDLSKIKELKIPT